MGESANDVITMTRAELDELVTRAAREAVEAEEDRRKEESVVYRRSVDMSARVKVDNNPVRQEIRRRREALGLSLRDLGRMAHVSPLNIQDIEEGGIIHARILSKTLNALCEAEGGGR